LETSTNFYLRSLSNLYARDVPGLSRAHSSIEQFSHQRRRKKKKKKQSSSTSVFVRERKEQQQEEQQRVFFGVIREKDNNERRLWHDERVVFIARGERFERFTPARAIGGDEQ
jgi:CRISPR/Cas system CSM-associated protein Csm5 (group 7 of RAMP superfamily)